MKYIRLASQNPNRPPIYALVDDEDFVAMKKFRWYYYKYARTAYAKTFIDGVCVGMHTLLLNPTVPGLTVDHIDGNGLNNQRLNLRLATLQQQRQNKSKHLNPTSRYKGVSYQSERNKWVAQICINGRQTSLGRFDLEIDAAKAYNRAAKLHYGEFAKITPLPGEEAETHGAIN